MTNPISSVSSNSNATGSVLPEQGESGGAPSQAPKSRTMRRLFKKTVTIATLASLQTFRKGSREEEDWSKDRWPVQNTKNNGGKRTSQSSIQSTKNNADEISVVRNANEEERPASISESNSKEPQGSSKKRSSKLNKIIRANKKYQLTSLFRKASQKVQKRSNDETQALYLLIKNSIAEKIKDEPTKKQLEKVIQETVKNKKSTLDFSQCVSEDKDSLLTHLPVSALKDAGIKKVKLSDQKLTVEELSLQQQFENQKKLTDELSKELEAKGELGEQLKTKGEELGEKETTLAQRETALNDLKEELEKLEIKLEEKETTLAQREETISAEVSRLKKLITDNKGKLRKAEQALAEHEKRLDEQEQLNQQQSFSWSLSFW